MSRATKAEIHTSALRHNLALVRRIAPRARVMAVLKANGYGHGLLTMAAALRHADAFAVSCMEEAIPLREAGYAHPILLLEGLFAAQELALARRFRLDLMVHSEWQLRILEQAKPGRPLSVWLKVDSGMHRLGFNPVDVVRVHARLLASNGVNRHVRLATHLACADDLKAEGTATQLAVFEQATQGLAGERSLANSAAVLGWPSTHGDWVRPGVMLYGVNPFVHQAAVPPPDLRPAMTLRSPLIAINHYRAGDRIGYAGTWTCPEDMCVGVVAIGYGDGYPRHAPNGTPVLIDGKEAALVGRVSMDMISVDLRGFEGRVSIGDSVVLWGDGLPVEKVAACAGTIGYELLCGITSRVHREDIEDGPDPDPV